jgi:phosphate starvation-inducible protein PhoH and related proteins
LSKKQRQRLRLATDNTVQFNDYAVKRKSLVLVPKSLTQEDYIEKLIDPRKMIVYAIGPAGTGKTMLAVLAGLKALKEGKIEKIILTRPAVGVENESHGFLPGDLNQKFEPWALPLYDIILDYYSPKEVAKMLEEKTIELAPLAFIRGRTFHNSWIIFDEAQNATVNQMKAILTRLGNGSKIVVTGDLNQTDKQFAHNNGLADIINRIKDSSSNVFGLVKFSVKDAQRSLAMKEVLKLYGEE